MNSGYLGNKTSQALYDSYTKAESNTLFLTELGVSGFFAKHIAGLIPSNGVDAEHDITISTGAAVDSSASKVLALDTTITKQIDAAWVAGDNVGGLFSGTVAADTTYHLFIIEKDSDGSIDAGFDTSLTAENIPTGYTAYRRVASFLTDGSANLLRFIGFETAGGGVFINYVDPHDDVNDSTPATTQTNVTMTIPTGISFLLSIVASMGNNANNNITIGHPDETLVAGNGRSQLRANTDAGLSYTQIEIRSNTSRQVAYLSQTSSVSSFQLVTRGFADERRD